MAPTKKAAKPLQKPEESRQGNFLELFFDVVVVVALAQLARTLIQDLGWNRAYQTLVLLLAIWLVWNITAWITDLHDPRQPSIQLLITGTMLGTLVMVVALPDAFGRERSGLRGRAYVAVHIGRRCFLFCRIGGPWVAGGALPVAAREVLWTLAVAMDPTGGVLRYPTPRMGRSPESEYPIGAEHLAERYRQLSSSPSASWSSSLR